MEPSRSTDLSNGDKLLLLSLARQSISHFLMNREPLNIELSDYPKHFHRKRASFVTLKINAKLRGCIGTTDTYRPLVIDVIEHAQSAAFRDPRFSPITEGEFEKTVISISVLTIPKEIFFQNKQQLFDQLTPQRDGLIIKTEFKQATFLPSVWPQIPQPEDFCQHLLRKANLPENDTYENLRAWKYQTIEFSETRGEK